MCTKRTKKNRVQRYHEVPEKNSQCKPSYICVFVNGACKKICIRSGVSCLAQAISLAILLKCHQLYFIHDGTNMAAGPLPEMRHGGPLA